MTVLKYYNESTSQWEPLVIGAQGPTGPQGIQGIQGVPGADGEGVPAGGTTDQVLAKVDGTDYNTAWVDAGGGLVQLATADLTGNTTVSFTNIDQNYTNLHLAVFNFHTEAGTTGRLRIFPRRNGGTTSMTVNGYIIRGSNQITINNDDEIRTDDNMAENNSGLASQSAYYIRFFNYANNFATPWKVNALYYGYTGAIMAEDSYGGVRTNAPIDGLNVSCSGGTFAGGTAILYGEV